MSFRPVFGKPRLLHDWGEEQHERETHWTSLFYDLLIVAALNAIAEPFEEVEWDVVEDDGEGTTGQMVAHLAITKGMLLNALLQFASVIIPWNSLNEITARFEDESFVGHLAFFVHCFGLASTTAGCVGKLQDNYKTLAEGIIITKIGLLVLYARPLCYIPRARKFVSLRCFTFVVSIVLILLGLSFSGPDAFVRFRQVLIVASLWDFFNLLLTMCFKREDRLPIHIQSCSDRIKEVTMVIFGEAILAVTLKDKASGSPQTRFYAALASTLWLIYSLALQENHIHPSVDDHALRRSVTFGFLWFYTQFFKQTALLCTSIGIKRAHLLTL
jgi:low temperature requirement protein LtrA